MEEMLISHRLHLSCRLHFRGHIARSHLHTRAFNRAGFGNTINWTASLFHARAIPPKICGDNGHRHQWLQRTPPNGIPKPRQLRAESVQGDCRGHELRIVEMAGLGARGSGVSPGATIIDTVGLKNNHTALCHCSNTPTTAGSTRGVRSPRSPCVQRETDHGAQTRPTSTQTATQSASSAKPSKHTRCRDRSS